MNKIKGWFFLFMISISVISCNKTTVDSNPKLVLIYDGPGVSKTGYGYLGNAICWDSVAINAGYKTVLLTGKEDITPYLNKNTIWVQPGGLVFDMLDSMTDKLKQQIVAFIAAGGGYVGSCAGAYLLGEHVISRDTTGIFYAKGLGVIPDTIYDELTNVVYSKYGEYNVFLQTDWKGFGITDLYWWWGNYFTAKNAALPNTTILAYYPNSTKILSLQTFYKKGSVIITGVHPEATIDWYKDFINPPKQPINYAKTNAVAKSMLDWAFANNHYGE